MDKPTEVKELVDQPAPVFTLVDLEVKLDTIYASLKDDMTNHESRNLVRGGIHELIHIVAKLKADFATIEMPKQTDNVIEQTLQTEKPAFYVSGVQLIEYKKLVGTSLYSTVVKARRIKDILNGKFAELKVDHEARIVQFPVF